MMLIQKRFAASLLMCSALIAPTFSDNNNNVFEQLMKQQRRIQEVSFPDCNKVSETHTLAELTSIVSDVIDSTFDPGTFENAVAQSTFVSNLKYGVEVRRSCVACTDINSQSPVFQEFCGSDNYGYNIEYSGLIILPIKDDGSKVSGTMEGMIFTRPSTTVLVPSNSWSPEYRDILIALCAAISSLGTAVIIPDFMGYAESAETSDKGFLIRKSYETSIIPLWLHAQNVVKLESDCQSAIANAVGVIGYSEGGYAGVVVADVLHRMGVEIINAQVGGAPFRVDSAAVIGIVKGIDEGTFNIASRYNLGSLASSYSSTYPDIANYDAGQDLLDAVYRESIVDLVSTGVPFDVLNAAIPGNEPLAILNNDFVTMARNATILGIDEPCRDPDYFSNYGIDLLCQALSDNALTETLQNANYPVAICHSPMDELISFENLPDIEMNSEYLTYIPATGIHSAAGGYCILTALANFVDEDFQNYVVTPEHSMDGCPSMAPSMAPSMPPSVAPVTTAPVSSPTTPTESPTAPTSSANNDYDGIYELIIAMILSSWTIFMVAY